ncbi:DNA methyltransferase [Paenibacillus tyrfis]|uniref:DNA methyltransferase n=1 Tax=Paenibacillus tyrfis TaxID=1501230 RepID=UPI00209FDB23|nr:DNA methyltransferase [Paenibacillus tyrfis]MCP1312589.1 site-specific DNA-methyltransferase [Paenibacillus tyrfis]
MLSYNATKIIDWSSEYLNYVSAVKNKGKSVNRWFPILEGFSNSFVESIIREQTSTELVCLDPFSGGGTTPLVAQELGAKCYSFEVSPFMSQVCRAKLRKDYKADEFLYVVGLIRSLLDRDIKHDFKIGLKTISKNQRLKKWLYHKTALESLLNIRKAIDVVGLEFPKYIDILYVALGSILLQFSNVFRDGKALRYKDNWAKKTYKQKDIYNTFLDKCINSVFSDINAIVTSRYNNLDFFYNGDCRQLIDIIEDGSLDLVITSPPYLNSRDYTDSHMIELWVLGHVLNYEDVRLLRRKTMRSHVQVKWGDLPLPNSKILENRLSQVLKYEEKFWNKNIPSMITGYFCDLEDILRKLKTKIKKDGKLYINVANSSYFGVVIETDRIIEEIASNLGYTINEIRLARRIKTSSQQYEEVKWLRETVIVLQNK